MHYTFSATVNYPKMTEDVPTVHTFSTQELTECFRQLVRKEMDATSFVITIAREQGE
jgi:hypothetical protein